MSPFLSNGCTMRLELEQGREANKAGRTFSAPAGRMHSKRQQQAAASARTNGVNRCKQSEKLTVEGPNSKSAGRLTGFMDLNDAVTVFMDVISCFKSSWTGMTHSDKFKDQVCTLL